MARNTRNIPQKTLAPADRAVFDQLIDYIAPKVGVHVNKQPYPFILDTRILLDLTRFPVARPQRSSAAWGGYFTYSPTYAALSPEQRWNYVAWLAGEEALGIQLFRIMRLHALCSELGGTRRDEAVVALRDLYERSQNDTVAQAAIGNILTLAYAATSQPKLDEWLTVFEPTAALALDLQARCYALSSREAPGKLLLELATRCNFKLGRGLSSRREQIETTMVEIAARWSAQSHATVISTFAEHTPVVPGMHGYSDTLVMWTARTLGIPQGSFVYERSAEADLLRGLAAAAQEQVRSQRKGAQPLDGLELLNGILNGDGNVVQFDLSGSAPYEMKPAEQRALQSKLREIADLPGITIVKEEWEAYAPWGGRDLPAPDAAIIRELPIKTPSSPQPWNVPSPPTYAGSAYRALTPEQRWWYLDWLAGVDVEPLPIFQAVRFKGLEAAFYALSAAERRKQVALWRHDAADDANLVYLIEALFKSSTDEALGRAALDILMPLYAEHGESERATAAFDRIPLSIDQGPRMLGLLWEAGGQLLGRGLLNVARSGGFNHTPLTRECFDQIAERAEQLLAEWEEQNGPLFDLPPAAVGFGRVRRRRLSGVQVAADIARTAQEQIKLERRSAPRSARMSADELAAERAELAELPLNAGDGPAEAIYQQLGDDPALVPVYLAHGVTALEQGSVPVAVAFLRRAHELDPHSPARQLLPLARQRLAEWQQQQEVR